MKLYVVYKIWKKYIKYPKYNCLYNIWYIKQFSITIWICIKIYSLIILSKACDSKSMWERKILRWEKVITCGC